LVAVSLVLRPMLFRGAVTGPWAMAYAPRIRIKNIG